MARDWEAIFSSWAQPPGQTELDRCDNAERAIRKAVAASPALSGRNVTAFAQGSYRNRTNVREDSDVDICILCTNTISYDLPEGKSPSDYGIVIPASYSYDTFKNDVEAALVEYFDRSGVTRGNKAFDIHENTYRISADAVPCIEHRWYQDGGSYLRGTTLYASDGKRITNWPEDNYQNGVAKNEQTGRRFKGVVRILKRLRYEMIDAKIASANDVPSYLVECLVWNVPNDGFGHDTLMADVRYALAHLCNETRAEDTCNKWGEINERKYLFHAVQPWTRQAVNAFLNAAWRYIGFE